MTLAAWGPDLGERQGINWMNEWFFSWLKNAIMCQICIWRVSLHAWHFSYNLWMGRRYSFILRIPVLFFFNFSNLVGLATVSFAKVELAWIIWFDIGCVGLAMVSLGSFDVGCGGLASGSTGILWLDGGSVGLVGFVCMQRLLASGCSCFWLLAVFCLFFCPQRKHSPPPPTKQWRQVWGTLFWACRTGPLDTICLKLGALGGQVRFSLILVSFAWKTPGPQK